MQTLAASNSEEVTALQRASQHLVQLLNAESGKEVSDKELIVSTLGTRVYCYIRSPAVWFR